MRFDWTDWQIRMHAHHGAIWGLERWFLMYFHNPDSLNALAHAIQSYASLAMSTSVNAGIESMWIDGTPQAVAISARGQVKCELADLLLIVQDVSPSGQVLSERGLLVQAKVASKPNRIPGGASTRKERRLLERMDRTQPLELYADTGAGSPIGSYTLGPAPGRSVGLEDCARYLLIPKTLHWGLRYPLYAPHQVGWPPVHSRNAMYPSFDFVQAIIQMYDPIGSTIGRSILQPTGATTCEWTRLVNDLRRRYSKTAMGGYGGQSRVYSSGFMSLASGGASPPGVLLDELGHQPEPAPGISTITVKIRATN